MVLRNKDGSIYKLKSPNALMKNQSIWVDYKLHNMNWTSTKLKDETQISKIPTNITIKDNFIEELELSKPDQTRNDESLNVHESIPQKVTIIEDKSRSDDAGIKKTFIYCLPAKIVKKRDALYDEEYNSVEYMQPFSFEGAVIDHHDLYYKFWSNLQISNESVIYPKSNIKRWWKVSSFEKKGNGFIYSCIPSEYQPHFEGV